ncbi:rhythmically expressed gene 5 protein-like [Scylla paramamosain]|uniref:rhythmically expressed gene 5 protein-like n=1 Tax=Scylla paramamosain TaxID=85552 RepID=UPI0030829D01
MQITQFAVIASVVSLGASHALPIWDMLPRQEKIGQIMYLFAHLVDQNCAYSYVPDCHHLFMLRGLSNLVNMSEHTLNKLDPQQRGAQRVIWGAVMRDTWLPPPQPPTTSPTTSCPKLMRCPTR